MVKSNKHAVDIEVKNIDLSDIKTQVKNSTLKISIRKKHNNWHKSTNALVIIDDTTIEQLDLATACSVTSDDVIKIDDFGLSISAASNCSLEFNCKILEIDVNAASHVTVMGKTDFFDLEVSDASNFDGYDLIAKEADVDVSAVSHAEINVSKNLRAAASSLASLSYKGDPEKAKIDESSMDSISHR